MELKNKKDHSDKKIKVDAPETVKAAEETLASENKELSEIREAFEVKEKEAKENYDLYLRAVAELDNYRKRAARDKADIIKYGKEDLVKDILPFLDSLDRALEHTESNDAQAFKSGIALIQEQLLCCLKKIREKRRCPRPIRSSSQDPA